MQKVAFDAVLAALRTVYDPDLKKDLVSLDMIKDLKIEEDGKVSLRIVLTTPACPLKAQLEREAREAIQKIPGVAGVSIKMDAQVRAKSHPTPGGGSPIEGVSHILAVSSGKGGVGKSTVAVNLACSLALDGARVGLLDADVYGPNIPTMMGVTEQPKLEVHPEKGERFIPPTAHQIKLMSIGFLIDPEQALVWRGPMLHSVVNQFCHKVNWGQLDYLVVDMPPGTGDVQLSFAQLVPVTGAILVTTPQEVSLQDVRKAYRMFETVKIPIMGLVENMSYFQCDGCSKRHSIFGSGGGELLARKFNSHLLAEIPLILRIREGGDIGQPIVIQEQESPVSLAFRELARKVAQQISILEAPFTSHSASSGE